MKLATWPTELAAETATLVPEVQGSTREVAIAKCRRAAELLGGPCITEDTALCFEALNGLPGPYIKYFLAELGHEGTICPTTAHRMSLIVNNPGLNNLLVGFPTTAAWALCTFAYSPGPGEEPILFEGRTDGRIVPARGEGKFGWDPVFEAQDTGKTYVHAMTTWKRGILTRLQLCRDGGYREEQDLASGPRLREARAIPPYTSIDDLLKGVCMQSCNVEKF